MIQELSSFLFNNIYYICRTIKGSKQVPGKIVLI